MSKRATPIKRPEIILDQNALAPLYRQLYERLRAAILAGQDASGRLAPSRDERSGSRPASSSV